MTYLSQISPVAAQPFDQDSCATRSEGDGMWTCPECHLGHCEECSSRRCDCPHIFAVIGRAIVELDDAIQSSAHLLSEIGPSANATEQPMSENS
jgi:hypothetical protein